MGTKLSPGTHTRVPTSPAGNPRIETVSPDGNETTHDGTTFTWSGTQGVYRARIPPPPSDPPGEWVFLEFDEGEGFNVYTVTPMGSEVWTETGKDYANG